MRVTSTLQRQHRGITQSIAQLSASLGDSGLVGTPEGAAQELASLAGSVRMHLALEDRALYPTLFDHQDPAVRKTARSFQAEMGKLARVFVEFVARWSSPTAIAAEPTTFVNESKRVLQALEDRISREEQILFPLLQVHGLQGHG